MNSGTNTTSHPINDLVADAIDSVNFDLGIDPDCLTGPPAGLTIDLIDAAITDRADHVLLVLAADHADHRDVANLLANPAAFNIVFWMVKDRINHTSKLAQAFGLA